MFPGYEVLEWLGLTAGSRLCRARRLADREPVLLKVLEAEPATPDQLARFRREHELVDSLHLPGVPRPLAFVAGGLRPAMVLEDCGGELLEAELASLVPLPRALRLGQQLAQTLAGLHEAQVLHRDLRPANLLVAAEEEARICLVDLSGAAPRDAPAGPTAGEGAMEGDPAYISPEQTGRMHHPVDHRTDLYSLGVILYRMLTGGLPFQANDPLEWVHCHLARTPASLTEVVPDLPRAVSDIVMKLLAKPPEDRYQSARGLALDLTRCLAQSESIGRIESFPLGEHDLADRFRIPQKLYGREREAAELLQAYDRVAARGTAELVLVSGYSGIGKSSLVHELYKSIVQKRGFFGSGKFEQYKRDIPYATFAQAFRALVQQILTGSEEQVQAWRRRLRDALGHNGQVIVDVIPELELVVGKQPPVPELPPIEAQHRFRITFRQLVGVFAQKEHPLVLFLDDLQWADSASLGLLAELVAHPDMRHLLTVGVYRDNEVTPAHPLVRALEEVRKAGARVSDIVLGPMAHEQLAAFVSETLHCPAEGAAPLSDLVHEKTAGNPFFAIQFLTALHEERLIEFDGRAGAFQWDVVKIRAKAFTDNVVELMVGKLRRLPAATQDALKQLACLGNSADVALLTMVLGQSEQDTHTVLREAARGGLVLRLDDTYTFLHDRIQEAAYSRIPEGERTAAHLGIGRLLLAHTAPALLGEKIFEIVNQLDRGAALIASREERERVAGLNLVAGKRAKGSTAYASALKYLAAGAALLKEEESWDRRYELIFALELQRAECEFLTGAMKAAEDRLSMLSCRAANVVDVAAVTCARVALYTTLDRSDRGVEACLEYLRRVGVEWSPHPTDEEVRQEFERMWQKLGSRSIEDLVSLPAMTDRDCCATMDVLTDTMSPALFTDANLLCLVVARMANLSLEHGNSDASCFAYVMLGMVLGSRFGDYQAAFSFGKLGLDLVEQRGLVRFRARVYLNFAHSVNPWTRHVRTSLELLRRGFDTAQETGDVTFAAYNCSTSIVIRLAAGAPLGEVQREAENALEFTQKAKFGLVVDTILAPLALIRALRGLTPAFSSFNDVDFDEGRFERHFEANPRLAMAACWYWIRKLQGRFHAGDHTSAIAAAARVEPLLWTSPSFFIVAEYRFYGALAWAAHHDTAPEGERPRHLTAILAHHRQLEVWARSCPENFGNRAALIAAEIARIEGRDPDAQRLYEQAIRSAHDNGFVHNEALAYETASRFYRARGFDLFADTYLREARACYARWGADGKVKQLDQHYPHLPEPKPLAPTATLAVRAEQLDLLTVIKASQAISGQMVLNELVETLMRVVLENAGAQTAALLLARGKGLALAAVAGTSRHGVRVRRCEDQALSPSELPLSILNYVRRSREHVLLSDATQPNPFAADGYLVQRQPKSILCLPILRQAELIGLLYLENNLVSNAFTPDRLVVLELLAGQAAISLETARLYTDLQYENSERRQAEAALRESQALLQGIIDTSTASIYVKDLDGRHLLVNRRLAEILRLERAAILGKTDYDLFPREQADAFRVVDQRVLATGTALSAEEVLPLEDGLHTYISIKAPLTDPSGRLYALCGISTDITERKRLEQQLQQSQKLESIGRLAGGVAHDFNNLLTVILGYTGFVKDKLAPDHAVQADLGEIRKAGERAAGLTRQLLAFARRQIVEPRILDLNAVVLSLDNMLRRLIGEDIELLTLPAAAPWTVKADPSQLEQVVVNLVVNARDAMPAGGILTIATSTVVLDEADAPEHPEIRPGEYVLLSVKDTGTGMTEEVKAHVFEPFYTTKELGKGTGLGLATCYGIVRQNGGHIELVSEVGKGTCFTVYLPRAHGRAALGESAREPAARPRGHETVLVVEDDPRVREFAVRVLGTHGYRVLEAADGEAAFAMVRKEPGAIHVLLTDVVMPKMGGKELAERLQALRPTLEVLYMSGYAQGALAHQGALDPGVALLQKPFTSRMLAQRMRGVLDGGIREQANGGGDGDGDGDGDRGSRLSS